MKNSQSLCAGSIGGRAAYISKEVSPCTLHTCMSEHFKNCMFIFPRCRSWRYNDKVSEYYVITEDRTMHKKSDTTREVEETECPEAWYLNHVCMMGFIYTIYANSISSPTGAILQFPFQAKRTTTMHQDIYDLLLKESSILVPTTKAHMGIGIEVLYPTTPAPRTRLPRHLLLDFLPAW